MNKFKNQYTKYSNVASGIEEMIEELGCGAKLPSIRLLMRKFQVSQATVVKALEEVLRKGKIQRISGEGFFIKKSEVSSDGDKHVDLCFFFQQDTFANNPLYSEMISTMFSVSHQEGIHLRVFACPEMDGLESFKQKIERNRPDAMILMCGTRITYELTLRRLGIPSVLLFPNAFDDNSISFLIDNKKAVEIIIEHLTNLGHKRIAFLHGQGFQGYYLFDQEERIESYYNAMYSKELLVHDRYITFGSFDTETGYKSARRILESKKRPTAIICNDYNAAGVYKAAFDLGLNIPDDLSVVGFDDVMLAKQIFPPLTTINIGWSKIAVEVMQMTHKLLDGNTMSPKVNRTPVKMMLRSSTGISREKDDSLSERYLKGDVLKLSNNSIL